MASPRAVYLDCIAQCMRQILQSSGYNTNAGLAVTLEPTPKLAESDEAFIAVVWSRQARATEPAVTRTSRATTVDIIARVPATLTDARERLDLIVEDIETALAKQEVRFPVGYQYPQYQSAEPLVPPAGAAWIGVQVTVTGFIPIHATT
ncbi:hypothetical protein QF205_10965 [Luteimonas composti]|uniref:DUF3168 domain-containing protein n=1 Tax=Luteimonas composti TaxID=398257 RepID=A0ABT6MTZ6_9GAMM|nr:hypothetical protein [Luteimonas composti]MDH7453583.1 hypothetical protein [Luteimonas composti]